MKTLSKAAPLTGLAITLAMSVGLASPPPLAAARYLWPHGTYTGTLTNVFQVEENYRPGLWAETINQAAVKVGAPLAADFGTSESNPFNFQLDSVSPYENQVGWLQASSADSFYVPNGDVVVNQGWLLSGSTGVFTGSLNPSEVADIAGSPAGRFITLEDSMGFPFPCYAAFDMGTTLRGVFQGDSLDLWIEGTGGGTGGTCGGVPLGFQAHFVGTGPSAGNRDESPPVVRALVSSGWRGRRMLLYYRVRDNSHITTDTLTVYRGSKVVKRITTGFGEAKWGLYSRAWRPPRLGGKWHFCVTSRDRAGNQSKRGCAKIRLR